MAVWEAHSSAHYNKKNRSFKNRIHGKAFRQAVAAVRLITKAVDAGLHTGGLLSSKSRFFLEKATGLICYLDWDKEEVQAIGAKANWNFKYNADDAWAYQSAKLFLDICLKFELSITFVYE